ncbi:hypothetical protein GF325_11855 [Candidatus Bathyarchaeota archaeon]|nr:hypothetical protein [Candidatus Bathyarchaeota archaeon]
MEFRFEACLDYQIDAINAVINVLDGATIDERNFNKEGVTANGCRIDREKFLENLQMVQERNGIAPVHAIEHPQGWKRENGLNLSIEMETGTGKTYVYLRTMFTLNQVLGLTKFIIVVPSIAIKEGLVKTLHVTKQHFHELHEDIRLTWNLYSSKDWNPVRAFTGATSMQLLIITRDSFNKRDFNKIYEQTEQFPDTPIKMIQATRPVVILDEPQKMLGTSSRLGIQMLDPLLVLRYSATHRKVYNLVYRLTPREAHERGLVKKIEIASISREENPNCKKVLLHDIKRTKSGIRARVHVFVKGKSGIRLAKRVLHHGDDLEKRTRNPYYQGFIVSEINYKDGLIRFENGITLHEGKSTVDDKGVASTMLKEMIEEHLKKKSVLNPLGIKVLSLVFIQRVDDYLPQGAWLKEEFEKLYTQAIKNPTHANLQVPSPRAVHSGYFSRMKSSRWAERDRKAFQLIMKDKERLLSPTEPVEFIFSHSALREGWDNPNVFNICTLAYSRSTVKIRQEIGRGLRLPVDSSGKRVHDPRINMLTVFTNETYTDYVSRLQAEYQEESVEAPQIHDKRERVILTLHRENFNGQGVRTALNMLSKRPAFIVNMDRTGLITQTCKEIREVYLQDPTKIEIHRGTVSFSHDGIDVSNETPACLLSSIPEVQVKPIMELERKTRLTRGTIHEILSRSGLLDEHINFLSISSNLEMIEKKINSLKERYLELAGIIPLRDATLEMHEVRQKIHSHQRDIFILSRAKSLYTVQKDGNSLFAIQLNVSKVNREKIEKVIQRAEQMEPAPLIFKLPAGYTVNTPSGPFHPFLAIIHGENESSNSNIKVSVFVLQLDHRKEGGPENPVVKYATCWFQFLKGINLIS